MSRLGERIKDGAKEVEKKAASNGDGLEKTAAENLVKLGHAIADQYLANQEAVDKMSPEMRKMAEEADYMGRVMAHSYADELANLSASAEAEKTAAEGGEAVEISQAQHEAIATTSAAVAQKLASTLEEKEINDPQVQEGIMHLAAALTYQAALHGVVDAAMENKS